MGFIYNDISSQEMGLKARLLSWQVSGALRNFTNVIPGKYGVADFGADLDERKITVSCSVFPKGKFEHLVQILDEISVWLSPLEGLKQLIFDEVPDRYFMARLKDKVDCERVIRAAGRFELGFFCPDPFSYAVNDEIFTLTNTGSHTVTREHGNIESFPLFAVKGELVESSENWITITVNGTNMKLVSAKLQEAETLVVDTGKMTAFVTNSDDLVLRNALPYLEELNFPPIQVGDNTVVIQAENAILSELKIYTRSRWR